MRKYTKAVSATLAGALAVGMVPAMALADEVELLDTADLADDMAAAGITEYAGDLVNGYKFTYTGERQGLVPEAVLGSVSGLTYDVERIEYWQAADTGATLWLDEDTAVTASYIGTEAPINVGVYYVRAIVDGTPDVAAGYAGKFEIVGQALTGAQVVEFDAADLVDGISDAGIVYDGTTKSFKFAETDGELGIVIGGKILASYDIDAIYDGANNVIWAPGKADNVTPTDAGDYTIAITAKDDAHKGQKFELPYTIQKYDLSDVTLGLNTIFETGDQPDYSDLTFGIDVDKLHETDFDLQHSATATNGAKTLTVTVSDEACADVEKNVKGTASLSYVIVTDNVSGNIDVTYDETDLDTATTITVGAPHKKNFAPELFEAKIGNRVLKEGEYSLVVVNAANNKVVDQSVLVDESAQGTYRVYVSVNPAAATIDYAYAGISDECLTVVVDNGEVLPANAAFVYGGSALKADEMELDYSGVDYAKLISTSVKTNAGATLVEGTDYTVEIKKGNKVVTEAVDKGEYVFTIKSTKYKINGSVSFTLTVDDAEVYAEFVDSIGQLTSGTAGTWSTTAPVEDGTVFYTGKEIDPVAAFWTVDETAKKAADKWIGMDVPASAYKVAIDGFVAEDPEEQPAKTPTAIKQAGWYKLTISDVKSGAAADNYEVKGVYGGADSDTNADDKTYVLYVTAANVFVDVASSAWYAPVVYDMATQGIVGGYGNGKFGPLDACDREDYALMIARMLGGVLPIIPETGSVYDTLLDIILKEDGTIGGALADEVILPFKDADGKAYYAEAVKYVNDNDIMTGYTDGSGEFGVNDNITREQAITVLYRIDQEKLYNSGTTLLASALDAYLDADEVSNYAAEAMAWGVENGIIGVDTKYLNPGDDISRAEICALLSRYMDFRGIENPLEALARG